jgi:nicotinate-nucleotide--dimethylbenzimidazole phosphoribosyltransferase
MTTPALHLQRLIASVPPLAHELRDEAEQHLQDLTKPPGSLGRLEDLALQVVLATGQARPRVNAKAVVIFAADHGITAEGVSPYPSEVTAQMVGNFVLGGAAVNALARTVGAELVVVDVGVRSELAPAPRLVRRKIRPGTANFAQGPAMSEEEAVQAILAGAEEIGALAAQGFQLFALGEMGIGNTSSASALTALLTGKPAEEVTGRGTGASDAMLAHKVGVLSRALSLHRASAQDPLAALACVGGLEIAAIAGACLGAAVARRVVLLDGFISTAGGAVAAALCPAVRGYLIASHRSTEPGHLALLDFLGKTPLLDLGMRLGEGTGATLALPVVASALAAFCEMATFSGAGVSTPSGAP